MNKSQWYKQWHNYRVYAQLRKGCVTAPIDENAAFPQVTEIQSRRCHRPASEDAQWALSEHRWGQDTANHGPIF